MNKKEFKKGLQDGIPIALGYYSVSLAFGVTAVLEGLPPAAAILISLTNLTSAGSSPASISLSPEALISR